MLGLQEYNSSDDSNDADVTKDLTSHLQPLPKTNTFTSLKTSICAAPDVVPTVCIQNMTRRNLTLLEYVISWVCFCRDHETH